VSLPQEAVSLPQEEVSLLQEEVWLPPEAVSLPQEAESLPQEAVSLPQEEVSLPAAWQWRRGTPLSPQDSAPRGLRPLLAAGVGRAAGRGVAAALRPAGRGGS
jgi:hypothetical protein